MDRNFYITKSKKSIIISLIFNVLFFTFYLINNTRNFVKSVDPVLLTFLIIMVTFFIYSTVSEFILYKIYKNNPVLSITNESLSFLKKFSIKTISINDIDSIISNRHNRFYIYLNDDSGLDLGFSNLSDNDISEAINHLKTLNDAIKVNN